ncbi:MAG: endopeptidase La [Clostridium sp.]
MKDNNITLPLIPLRGIAIFPNMVMHFDVGRKKSIASLEQAMLNNGEVYLVSQLDENIEDPYMDDLYSMGTICSIKQILKLPNDVTRVLVEGKERAKIVSFIDRDEYLEAEVDIISNDVSDDVEIEAYYKLLKKEFKKYISLTEGKDADVLSVFKDVKEIGQVVDIIASYVIVDDDKKQIILETIDVKERLSELITIIQNETVIAKVEKKIALKVKKKIDETQKEYYLREQIKAIQQELGDDEEDDVDQYAEKIEKAKLPAKIKEKAKKELKRLKLSSSNSSEAGVIRTYLDWILETPWGIATKDKYDIEYAENVLDTEHYGLEDVKERIIEYLTVKSHTKTIKGPILCLVGPPGVGKTSIARSVAKALNRNYARIALGGLRDEAEIRGHRKTYVGAIPGRIIYALKEAKSNNPLILFDEIDKLGSDHKGNPADALLEVLDSEQNKNFRDNYMELDFDLSKVLFITTANSLDTIPRPLLDRMEIIEVSGYTYEEKFNIAKKHLIPKILKEHSAEDVVKISDSCIKDVINYYTRESGVRSLERVLSKLTRKGLTDMVKSKKETINISVNKLESYLGVQIYSFDKVEKEDKVGVVTGMAWTAYGGDTLPVEVAVMDGSGKLELTGQLGDVMKESAKTAYSYVRANSNKFDIDKEFYKNKDIHIHAPEGAVPKDGPSAGVAMVTALVSALSNKKIRSNVAMTGEVTLTGRVLPIGGVKEKTLAAHRAGIDTVILPKENEKDITKIPHAIRSKLDIHVVSDVKEVLNKAIIGVETNEN